MRVLDVGRHTDRHPAAFQLSSVPFRPAVRPAGLLGLDIVIILFLSHLSHRWRDAWN